MKRSLSSLIEDTNVREFKIIDIQIDLIKESTSQPRTYFDKNKLQELSESIKKKWFITTNYSSKN